MAVALYLGCIRKQTRIANSHAKDRATDYKIFPLPWNKRQLAQRYLVFGIEEAAAFGKPATGAARLRFILFCQVGSSSPVFS